MIKIVLADDHLVVRQGLRALLSAESDFSVVGEAGDGLEVLRVAERLKPDVLVLDLMMPGLTGLEVSRQVGKLSPQTRVVVLSMHANEAYVLETLRNGAYAYVLKDSGAEDLVTAVRQAAAGHRFLSPPLSERAIEAYQFRAGASSADPYETLTDRERQVFQLAAEGHTSTEIAARLGISPRTAETHRTNLMRKLNLRGHSELIRYALRRGIVPIDQ